MMDYGFSSEIDPDDERQPFWAKEREEFGFDHTEMWALDQALAKMILPRLKHFKECHICFPPTITAKKWDNILQSMIDGFEEILTRDLTTEKRGREWDVKKIQKGLRLFAKWYFDLWS
jgi:hypothetical protein